MKHWTTVVLMVVITAALALAAHQKPRFTKARPATKPTQISVEERAANSVLKAEMKARAVPTTRRELTMEQAELRQLDEQIARAKELGETPNQEWYDRIERIAPSPRERNGRLDEGGDVCASATVIPSLPATLDGNTFNFNNNYDAVCPYLNSSAKDVVYSYAPVVDQVVTVSLCRSSYDTKLYIYRNQCSGVPVACSDDTNPLGCPNGASFTRSYIENLTLLAGNTYFIVVDGYYIYAGPYTLDITESPGQVNPPPGTQCGREPMFYPGYVDHFNGGCLSDPPVFEPITCGSTVCGAAGYMTSETRDEDWYTVTISEPESLVWKVLAEFDVSISIEFGNCGDPARETIISAEAEALDTAQIGVCLPAGTYYLSVVPTNPTNQSVNADYNAWLTCSSPCTPPEEPPIECLCLNDPNGDCNLDGGEIPDESYIQFHIWVPDWISITEVTACLDITHTYDSDLAIYLTSPAGTYVTLANGAGDGGDDFHCTTFDDEAQTAIDEGEAPFTGSYRPENPLSLLNGENAYGWWTLEIIDEAAEDVGTLNFVCLFISGEPITPIECTCQNSPTATCVNSGAGIYDYQTTDVPIVVASQELVGDVNVCLDIKHTSDSDLLITLISPEGTEVVLSEYFGGTGNGFICTSFDDAAQNYIGSGTPPFLGTYYPVGSLSDFNGEPAGGEWVLRVTDRAGADEGVINWVCLDITGVFAPPNDQCENALPLQIPGTIEGSTCGAQDDYHPCCNGILQRDDCRFGEDASVHECDPDGLDIVYTIVPDGDISLTLTTCGSDFDTKLLVYRDACGPEGTLLACNDDNDCAGEWSLSSTLECIPLEAGETYFIVVDGYSQGECGNFVLTASLCGCDGEFECPEGARFEYEEICHYGHEDHHNGGCCTNWRHPNTQPIYCGDVICGRSGTYYTDDDFPDCHHRVRDHDWYELNLSSRDTVFFSGYAEFPLLLRLGQPGEDDQRTDDDERCDGLSILATAHSAPCETATIEMILDPGTYWLMVCPVYLYGVQCGERYVISLDCECAECPEGSLAEGEGDCYDGYSDGYNGDCDDQGVQFMNCGDTYCGTGGIYRTNNVPRRDTDYYRFDLSEETYVRACVVAEFPVSLRFFDDDCDSEGSTRNGDECEEVCLSRVLDEGTHYVRVRPVDNVSVPCGSQYTIHLSCQTPSDQNRQTEDCPPVSDLTITTNSEGLAVLNWTADSDGDYRVYSTTNPYHGNDPDLDEDGMWTLEATVSQTVGIASWVTPAAADSYRNYVVLKMCP